MPCMNCISAALFERPLWLLAMLAAAEVVTLVLWRARRTRRAGMVSIAPVLLAAAVLLLSWLVVTDREYIERAYEVIAADVAAGGTDALATYLDEDVEIAIEPDDSEPDLDKAGAIRLAEHYVGEMKLREVKLSRMTIGVSGDRAETEVTTTLLNDWPEVAGARLVLSWSVKWVKRDDGWRILRAEPTGPPGARQAD